MERVRRVAKVLRKLHRDERGADMVEYILIIAAVALPLLGVIIWFWGDIKTWVQGGYQDVRDSAEDAGQTP